MSFPCDVIGCGTQGIDEMQRWINDTTVSWAFVRVDVGEGPLRRHRNVFLHINSENCPQVKRAKLNREFTADIQNLLRGGEDGQYTFHAELEVFRKSDVTARNVLEKCSKHFLKDVHAENSTQWLLEQYEKQFQPEDACAGKRENDRCPGEDLALEEVVKLMHGDSNYNWALFGANMEWVQGVAGAARDRSLSRTPAPPEEAMMTVPSGGWGSCSGPRSRSNSRNRAIAPSTRARTSVDDASSTFEPSLPPIPSQRTLPTVTLPSGSDSAEAPTAGNGDATPTNDVDHFHLDIMPVGSESIATSSTVHRTDTDLYGGIVTSDAAGDAPSAESLDLPCHTTGTKKSDNVGSASMTKSDSENQKTDASRPKVQAVNFSGPLKKKSGASSCVHQKWQLRWFQIEDGCLKWWDHPEKVSEKPNKCLRLVDMEVAKDDGSDSMFMFSTACGKAKRYLFDADVMGAISQYGKHADGWNATRDDWIKNLKQEEYASKQRSSTVGGA